MESFICLFICLFVCLSALSWSWQPWKVGGIGNKMTFMLESRRNGFIWPLNLLQLRKKGEKHGERKIPNQSCVFHTFFSLSETATVWLSHDSSKAWIWNLSALQEAIACKDGGLIKKNTVLENTKSYWFTFWSFLVFVVLLFMNFGHFLRILFMFLEFLFHSPQNLEFALELSGMHCMQKQDRSPMCLSQYWALSAQQNLPASPHWELSFFFKTIFRKSYLQTTLYQIDSSFPETFL